MKSAIFNIHAVINLIVLVEILFLCVVIKKYSNRNKESRSALIALFITVAFVQAGGLLVWNDYFQSVFDTSLAPALLTLGLLLEGPALLAYLYVTAHGPSFNRFLVVVHLVPSLVAVTLIFSFNISSRDWLPPNWSSLSPEKYIALQIVWWLFKCIPVLYIGVCWYAEFQVRKKMRDVLSSISQFDLRLMDIILVGFFVQWLWSFIGYILGDYISAENNELIGLVNSYVVIVLINILLFFGLTNGREFLGGHSDTKSFDPAQDEVVSLEDEKNTLSRQSAYGIEIIDHTIVEKKPYLDSRLNLDRFAEACGLRSREVSFLLNSHYKKNFYEFINELRVNEVKRLLVAEKHKSILELAMDSGFNSHSAFQRFFKRFVGMSPSEYRKRQEQS